MSCSKPLFFVAAAFNVAVAAGLTLGWPLTQSLLQLAPADGSNWLLVKVASVLILTFGYAYFMVGLDPVRYRPYATLGMIGKLLVVAVALPVIVASSQGYLLAWLAMGDLLFAILFAVFLRGPRHV
ncbi:hypothetical protein [Solimonas terrae]|uniref:Uncharacterized protein n=1 Tax=Solimonas terrae TaxID=1396819 RepID=A0A6M2BTH2_9GAMM|nr:hypothetical protein [Solimonas terrae]NGY05758.1 hypothetical protein [Solimonas terrae]